MAEAQVAEGAAPQNASTGGGEQPGTGEATVISMTTAQLEARLARERQKFADYEDLKTAKQKLDEIQAEQLSELEKAQKRAAEAEAAKDRALQEANDRLIKAAFIAEAAKAGAAHPEDAFALADLGAVAITDDGAVSGVAEAVKALVEGERLVMTGRPTAPNLDGGAGGGERTGEKAVRLSQEELEMARKMGLTPEQYQKGKKP